ncbi:MFS transporter [Demequina sp.]|uniref:MFS transporter n=1 Tax=Demequina sp. TaxID=2050685 RepID=UPI0025C459F4|nr:MFS transporter [Demequina sp.]
MVVGLGLVSLTVDMVADGARSISGPLLAQLGASALAVGAITGATEAAGFTLRLVSGPLADRTRRYWDFTFIGYALTALSVPLLAITPTLGVAGLSVAAALLFTERVGKAIRSPAKTVLLADAAGAVGRGRGFGVHKTLDQVGAFLGPLVVAGVIALTGVMWPAFLVLIIPAAIAMLLLVRLRRRVPDPSAYARAPEAARSNQVEARSTVTANTRGGLHVTFMLFAVSFALSTFGMVGFGVISFHLADSGIVELSVIPLIFALGMLAAAVSALVNGWAYDRIGASVMLVVPVLVACIPALALSTVVPAAVAGVVVWGAAVGIQDSTVKALVADLAPSGRRGTAYGVFAVLQGATTFASATLAGALYHDRALLTGIIAAAQLCSLVLLITVIRRRRRLETPKAPSE